MEKENTYRCWHCPRCGHEVLAVECSAPIRWIEEVEKAIHDKYAWPMYLVMQDGEAVCMECGKKEWKNIKDSTETNKRDGWNVVGVDVNWEASNLCCAHCSTKIESAYGGVE